MPRHGNRGYHKKWPHGHDDNGYNKKNNRKLMMVTVITKIITVNWAIRLFYFYNRSRIEPNFRISLSLPLPPLLPLPLSSPPPPPPPSPPPLFTFATGLEDTMHRKERLCKVGLEVRWGAGGWMGAIVLYSYANPVQSFFFFLMLKNHLKQVNLSHPRTH
jgi:hypothetical protein